MTDHLHHFLDTLESQTNGKVYCQGCQWFTTPDLRQCRHQHAEVHVEDAIGTRVSYHSVDDRNRHHDCPDFEAGEGYFEREAAVRLDRSIAEHQRWLHTECRGWGYRLLFGVPVVTLWEWYLLGMTPWIGMGLLAVGLGILWLVPTYTREDTPQARGDHRH